MTGRGEQALPAKPPAVHALADMMEPSVVPDIPDPELESEMMEHPGGVGFGDSVDWTMPFAGEPLRSLTPSAQKRSVASFG